MDELVEVTRTQQAMWARGDFHRIGVGHVLVGEQLVHALHVHGGERVLDVAGGAGNTALAAARRWADVTCTDFVPDLLAHAEVRAAAEGLPMRCEVADAQALPYPDASFDVVTSTFGAMFAPDQERTARELLRVLRPGGRLGMANWTPDSWVGRHLGLRARYMPPPPVALEPPTRWGTRERLDDLLGRDADLSIREQSADFVHHNTAALFELYRQWFGPVVNLLASVGPDEAEAYRRDWLQLADEHNLATDGTCEVPSAYLEVVATKRA